MVVFRAGVHSGRQVITLCSVNNIALGMNLYVTAVMVVSMLTVLGLTVDMPAASDVTIIVGTE